MYRYGQDFGRPSTPGWRRPDLGSRAGHSAYRGRPGGDLYFDEAREPWAPRYQGYGYPRDRGYGPGPWGRPARAGWMEERGSPYSTPPRAADRTRVAQIMTHHPEAVTAETSLHEVAKRMRDLDVGIIPVVSDRQSRRLEGVITDRDITVRAVADGEDVKKTPVASYMTTDIESVRENDSIREVFDIMKRDRVRRVPVTDAEGKLVGIVAQADLATSYAGLDQEREIEVEEVIERISEPGGSARRWGQRRDSWQRPEYDADLKERVGARVRDGWRTIRREARHLLRRGYDQGW